jgi:hypothetical protein
MPTVVCNLSALAVATLYYCWRAHHHVYAQRARLLRERVAYMLWVMANSVQ